MWWSRAHTRIGEDCTVRNFANLGGPPQHTGYQGEPTELVIGDRNMIREHVTMHIGTVQAGGVTRVGYDGMFMVDSHVGHDCIVGDNVILANYATLGGHVQIGDFVIVGGLAAVHQYCRVGRYAFIGGLAAVTKDVIPYGLGLGQPRPPGGPEPGRPEAPRLQPRDDQRAALRLSPAVRRGGHLPGAPRRHGRDLRRLARR